MMYQQDSSNNELRAASSSGGGKIPVSNLSEEHYHDGMRLGDSPYYGGSGSSGDGDGGVKSSLDLKVPRSNKGQNYVTLPKEEPESSSHGAQQQQAGAMTTPTQKNPLNTEGEIFRHMFARQQNLGDEEGFLNQIDDGGSSSSSSGRSKSSADQYPPHLKTMMADGIPVTQWVILLVLLGAGVWQFRKAIIPEKAAVRKRESVKGSKSSGKSKNKSKRSGGKKLGNGSKRAPKNHQPALETVERELVIEGPKVEATHSPPVQSAPTKSSKVKSNKKKRQKQKARKALVTEQQDSKKVISKGQESSPDSVSTDESSSGTAAEAKSKPPMNELDVPQPSLVPENQDEDYGWETVPAKSSKASRSTAAAGSPQSVVDNGSLQHPVNDVPVEQQEAGSDPDPKAVEKKESGEIAIVKMQGSADAATEPVGEAEPQEQENSVVLKGDVEEPKRHREEAPETDDKSAARGRDAQSSTGESIAVEESEKPQQEDPSEAKKEDESSDEQHAKVAQKSRPHEDPKLDGGHDVEEKPAADSEEPAKDVATENKAVHEDEDAALAQRLQAEEEKLLAYEKQQEKMRSTQQDTWEEVATKKKKKTAAAGS